MNGCPKCSGEAAGRPRAAVRSPRARPPEETVTEGLDGLRDRLAEYHGMAARFAKWRAGIRVTPNLPSPACVSANAHALARYAALCQERQLVPIVEPEVLMNGAHPMERCEQVTGKVLHAVFDALFEHGVSLEAMLLKPNMVTAGTECPRARRPPRDSPRSASSRVGARPAHAARPQAAHEGSGPEWPIGLGGSSEAARLGLAPAVRSAAPRPRKRRSEGGAESQSCSFQYGSRCVMLYCALIRRPDRGRHGRRRRRRARGTRRGLDRHRAAGRGGRRPGAEAPRRAARGCGP